MIAKIEVLDEKKEENIREINIKVRVWLEMTKPITTCSQSTKSYGKEVTQILQEGYQKS